MARISSSRARSAGVGDRRERLDPAVEVARHEVGRPDEVLGAGLVRRSGRCASARGTARRSTAPGSSRTGRGRPGAGSRCRARSGRWGCPPATPSYSASMNSGSTRLFIFIVIRPSGPSAACSAMRLRSSGRRRDGRDEELAVLALPAVAGEVVEELGEVGAELRVGGEQADVLVERRPSSGCSCRCRRGSSGGCRRAPGARPGGSWCASSGRRARTRRARPPLRRCGPVRCWPARRSAPSARRAPRPACPARRRG